MHNFSKNIGQDPNETFLKKLAAFDDTNRGEHTIADTTTIQTHDYGYKQQTPYDGEPGPFTGNQSPSHVKVKRPSPENDGSFTDADVDGNYDLYLHEA
jgi:hypothetical protein